MPLTVGGVKVSFGQLIVSAICAANRDDSHWSPHRLSSVQLNKFTCTYDQYLLYGMTLTIFTLKRGCMHWILHSNTIFGLQTLKHAGVTIWRTQLINQKAKHISHYIYIYILFLNTSVHKKNYDCFTRSFRIGFSHVVC